MGLAEPVRMTTSTIARLLTLVLVIFASGISDAAIAQGNDEPGDENLIRTKNALQGHLGFASAVGLLGLTYERDIASHLAVEGGIGLGLGFQFSLMPKVIFADANRRFSFGLGVSKAIGADGLDITWINVDAFGLERRFRGGLVLSGAVGVAVAASASNSECGDVFCVDIDRGDWTPQLRTGVGYAF